MLGSRRRFRADIELRHNQLRDLVTVSDGIWFPESRELCKLDHNGKKSRIAPLPISPHCITASRDIVLCGGISVGTGMVVGVGKTVETCEVGRGLINAVGFTDATTGFACSNDNGIYFGDVSYGWRNISKLCTQWPLNAANCSTSQGLLAISGDKRGVQLCGGRGSDWRMVTALNTGPGADVSTSVMFDDGGQLIAAAFQCGEVYIWDVRSLGQPLATFHSIVHGPRASMGPFRVVRFADSNQDYVFATEERGAVHTFDLRTMEQHVIMLDQGLTVYRYSNAPSIPYTYPQTLGLATCGRSLVVAAGDEILETTLERRNQFPTTEWR